MENINTIKNDIINATIDLEMIGEPTDILVEIANNNNTTYEVVEKIYYDLLEA